MTRDYFQDILPPEGTPQTPQADAPQPRSIRNLAPSARPRFSRASAESAQIDPRALRAPRRGRNFLIWGLIVIALIALGFAASTVFMRTTVTLVPRQHTAVFDQQNSYTAYPANDPQAPTGSLSYSSDTQSFDTSMSVPTSGSEQVSVAASGSITIYNTYSASPVRLIKNTRFETPDGKIFRIRDSIVVPGKSATGPGSLKVTIYADQPGDSYNIAPVDRFTLPGLKNTADMYAGVYAHSDSPMTGGFQGTRPSITDSARAAAQAQLQTAIMAKITAAYADLSKGYAIPSLASIQYDPITTEVATDGTATVKEHASVTMPLLPRDALDSFLASQTNVATADTAIKVLDPSTFAFVATPNPAKPISLGTDAVDFSLSGKVTFVWQINTAPLAKDLAGKNKATFQAIVAGYPSIDSATAKVYPLWSQTFPTDPNSIRIVISSPTAGK